MFLFCYRVYVCSGASRFTVFVLFTPGVRFYTPKSLGAKVVNGGGFPISSKPLFRPVITTSSTIHFTAD